MHVKLAWIGNTKQPAIKALTDEYLRRIARYVDCQALVFRSEAALLSSLARKGGAGSGRLVLLDQCGKEYSSEELARFIQTHRDRVPVSLTFAIGAADGFSQEARRHASLLLSLSRMTLPHELARVVLLEQVYRAFSILHGHPYHLGH